MSGLIYYRTTLVICGWTGHWPHSSTSHSESAYLLVSARAVSSRPVRAPSHAFREHARSDCESSGSPAAGGTRSCQRQRLRCRLSTWPRRRSAAELLARPSKHDQMCCCCWTPSSPPDPWRRLQAAISTRYHRCTLTDLQQQATISSPIYDYYLQPTQSSRERNAKKYSKLSTIHQWWKSQKHHKQTNGQTTYKKPSCR